LSPRCVPRPTPLPSRDRGTAVNHSVTVTYNSNRYSDTGRESDTPGAQADLIFAVAITTV
jgi:hypothetical protein